MQLALGRLGWGMVIVMLMVIRGLYICLHVCYLFFLGTTRSATAKKQKTDCPNVGSTGSPSRHERDFTMYSKASARRRRRRELHRANRIPLFGGTADLDATCVEELSAAWDSHTFTPCFLDDRITWLPKLCMTFNRDNEVQEGWERIWLLQLNRCPEEVLTALLFGPDLQHVRKQLRDHGHDIIHNGVKVFVWASQHGQVMDAFWRFREERPIKIQTSHIIVSNSFLPSLEACLQKIPCSHKAYAKKNCRIELTSCTISPPSGSASSSQNVFSGSASNPAL